MYIIEYKNKWLKKEGKLSFCKVFKDKGAEDEIAMLMDKYLKDLSALIEAKLMNLSDKYDVPENEIKRINDLILELKNASITSGETNK